MNPTSRTHSTWPWVGGAALVTLGIALAVWATDRVTWQGERVLYGVSCAGGEWRDLVCNGSLTAGDRYAFRASPRRNEVIAWTIGSSSPSQTYSGCNVVGRDQWSCPVRTLDGSNATLSMSKHGVQCIPPSFLAPATHVIAKWKWYLLRLGVTVSSRVRGTVQTAC